MIKRFFYIIVYIFFYYLASYGDVQFSHASGVYKEDIEFKVSSIEKDQEMLISFFNSDGSEGPWVHFDGQMELAAVTGEKRLYSFRWMLTKDFEIVLEKDFNILINKIVPRSPELDLESGEYPVAQDIRFKSDNNLNNFYKISGVKDVSETHWEGVPLTLPGLNNQSLKYNIEVYSKNKSGYKSQSSFYEYTITKKEDYKPELKIYSPVEGKFSNTQALIIQNNNFKLIKYTINGSDPKTKGKIYLSPVKINATGKISLKIWALPRWTGYPEEEKTINYSVEEPKLKLYTDIEEGIYSKDLEIRISSDQESDEFLFSIDETQADLSNKKSKGLFNIKKTDSLQFFPIRLRPINSSETINFDFRFCYIVPPKPYLLAKYRLSKSNYRILFSEIPEGHEIYYSIDNSFPDSSQNKYKDNFTISQENILNGPYAPIRAGLWDSEKNLVAENLYAFPFEVMEEVKNAGEVSSSLGIEIPKEKESSSLIKIPKSKNVLYEISSDNTPPIEPNMKSPYLNNDLILTLPFGMERVFTIKFSHYDSGTEVISPSSTYKFKIDKKPPENPMVKNYTELVFSNKSIEIEFEKNNGKIFYELSEDGTTPQINASQITYYTKPFRITGKSNKNIIYRLKALSADEYGNVSPSIVNYKFRIDKSPPANPEEPVISPYGNTIEQKFQIYWQNSAMGTIYYRIVDEEGSDKDFEIYKEPVLFNITQNPRQLRIEYYLKNSIGNQSPVLQKNFASIQIQHEPSYRNFIDSKIIYVSESNSVTGRGTKENPFSSLNKACEYAQNNNIKTIFLSKGTYQITEEIIIKKQIEFFGGFDPVSWNRDLASQTIISATPNFPFSHNYFKLQETELYLTNIYINNISQRVPNLISARSSYLRINDSQFRFSGMDQTGISMSYGKCEIVNSSMISDNVSFGSFIHCEGGELKISGSSFIGKGNSDTFKAIVLHNSPESVLRFVSVSPGSARDTVSLDVNNSKLTILQSKIETGTGLVQSIGLNIIQSQVELSKSLIRTKKDSPFSVGFTSNSSVINIRDTLFEISGKSGATGVALSRGESVIANSRFKGLNSQDYVFLVQLNEGHHQLYNNVFWAANSSDSISLVLKKSNVNLINNTFFAGIGSRMNEAININSVKNCQIINNIFTNSEYNKGNAIHIIDDNDQTFNIQNNCFASWENLVLIDKLDKMSGFSARQSQKIRIEDIEALNSFDNNQVQDFISQNISEDYIRTFRISKQQEYHLSSFSDCINRGQDIFKYNIPLLTRDIDEQERPSKNDANQSVDIGADEYYP